MGIEIPHTGGRNGGLRKGTKQGNDAIRRRSETWSKVSEAKRKVAYEVGRQEVSNLFRDTVVRDFVCLYWAEGYKRSRHTVSVINTDPDIVVLCAKVMRRFATRPLIYKLYCSEEEKDGATDFWSKVCGVNKEDIRFQAKKQVSQRRAEHGLVSVSAHETMFRSRLQAWMDALKKEWGCSSSG